MITPQVFMIIMQVQLPQLYPMADVKQHESEV